MLLINSWIRKFKIIELTLIKVTYGAVSILAQFKPYEKFIRLKHIIQVFIRIFVLGIASNNHYPAVKGYFFRTIFDYC